MDWKIRILDVYGVPKAIYTNSSPGGIVDYIEFNLEPSGNCLNAAFDGIPYYLNIAPRDFVQIYVDDMDTPKYYGYLTNHFNRTSKKVARYTVEGVKKLLNEHVISDFWFKGTADVEDSSGATTLVSHKQIVDALQSRLPEYVSQTIDNTASTVTGNKPPIIANDVTFGEVVNGIVDSATDGKYVWGVNANRRFFVAPLDTDVINFDGVTDKRVVFPAQNTDRLVTGVKFVFTLPSALAGDGLTVNTSAANHGEFNASRGMYDTVYKNGSAKGVISYSYEDEDAASQYGSFPEIVPLILSDSWMREISLTEFLDRDASVTLAVSATSFETQSGSTNPTNLRTAILDPSDSSYVRNQEALNGFTRLNLQFQKTSGDKTLPIDDFVGFVVYYHLETTEEHTTWLGTEFLYRAGSSTEPRALGSPYRDWIGYKSQEGAEAPTDGIYRLVMSRRSLQEYEVDPLDTDTDGYNYKSIWRMTLRLGTEALFGDVDADGNPRTLAADKFRILGIKMLVLNTDALDNYAQSFVITPVSFPAEITVTEDLGLEGNAQYQEETLPIQRVRTIVSRQEGYEVTYIIGDDQERNNQAINRIFQRDSQMLNRAVNISQGNG